MPPTRLLFLLIRCALTGESPDFSAYRDVTEEDWTAVYALAKKHDLAHLVGYMVTRCGLPAPDGMKAELTKAVLVAGARYQKLAFELNAVKQVLSENAIPFVPLKGALLRDLYPEGWMRTSCDVDILLHEEDVDRTATLLEEKFGYRFDTRTAHDVSGVSPRGIPLELHYRLIEGDVVTRAETPLQGVWDAVTYPDGTTCGVLSDAMFLYYHYAHMGKHFEFGGCGIRPFLDLFVLRSKHRFGDDDERKKLLSDGDLTVFADACERLTGVWLEGGEHDDVTRRMEGYLLSGGVYGTVENYVSVQQIHKGGKVKYVLSRLWLSRDQLSALYPGMKKHPCLLPWYQMRRWFGFVKNKKIQKGITELRLNAKMTESQTDSATEMLKDLKLI